LLLRRSLTALFCTTIVFGALSLVPALANDLAVTQEVEKTTSTVTDTVSEATAEITETVSETTGDVTTTATDTAAGTTEDISTTAAQIDSSTGQQVVTTATDGSGATGSQSINDTSDGSATSTSSTSASSGSPTSTLSSSASSSSGAPVTSGSAVTGERGNVRSPQSHRSAAAHLSSRQAGLEDLVEVGKELLDTQVLSERVARGDAATVAQGDDSRSSIGSQLARTGVSIAIPLVIAFMLLLGGHGLARAGHSSPVPPALRA
ncbi:MAG: hypothetical protein M3198_08495, partial [Actinomycetota bacterium]|nr:hypothetical protein [Actinomycetota bacterium]